MDDPTQIHDLNEAEMKRCAMQSHMMHRDTGGCYFLYAGMKVYLTPLELKVMLENYISCMTGDYIRGHENG